MATVKTFRINGPLSYDDLDNNTDNLNNAKIERVVTVNDSAAAIAITQTGAGAALNVNNGVLNVNSTSVSIGDRLSIQDEIALGNDVGEVGEVMTSGGPGQIPTWKTPVNVEVIQTKSVAGGNSVIFSGLNLSKYSSVYLVLYAITHSSTSAILRFNSTINFTNAYNGVTNSYVGKVNVDFFTVNSSQKAIFNSTGISTTGQTGTTNTNFSGESVFLVKTTPLFSVDVSAGAFTGGYMTLFGVIQ